MNRRDIELLSAYLDGELKTGDSTKLEARLKTNPELASVLSDLRATRTLLRKLPSRKASRNFTLTRKMVGQNPPLPRTYPIFRLTTILATLLFFFSIGINSFRVQMASQPIGFGMGGGNDSLAEQAMPATEEPAASAEEPAAPPAAQAETYADSTGTEEPSAALAAPQPTDDSMRVMETPSEKSAEIENALEREGQNISPVVSSAWLVGLAIIALAGALLMVLMWYVSVRRWK
jgi:hypothetical protein